MGLFKSSEKKESKSILPKLPELPELPSLGSIENSEEEKTELHALPSFPTDSLGEKFSQDTIKNAVLGEDNFEGPAQISLPEKPALLRSIMPPEDVSTVNEVPQKNESPPLGENSARKISPPSTESKPFLPGPIFVRIDKFEDSLKIFENSKKKIKEMEDLLRETRVLKQKEEEELSSWEAEIDQLKKQLEKVDKDIFDKIE